MSLRRAFESPASKARYVRGLFATIADRYDLITALLSYGQDARWKARLVHEAQVRPGERALDLACGTGDIALAVAAQGARTVGLDVTLRMLELADDKSRSQQTRAGRRQPVVFLAGDMATLPFAASTFDLITTGYGLRNVPDLRLAINEAARVLRPRGRLLSLDFNRPQTAIVRTAYLAYLTVVGATLGWMLHGDADTYRYIPESIKRYPGAHGVATLLREGGFTDVRVLPLLGGLMTLHVAQR